MYTHVYIYSTSRRTRFLPKRDLAGTGGVGSWFKRRIDDITPDALDIQVYIYIYWYTSNINIHIYCIYCVLVNIYFVCTYHVYIYCVQCTISYHIYMHIVWLSRPDRNLT